MGGHIPAIEVIGRDGRNLGKWWRETKFQAYQGVSVPYFPNFLSLASPFAFLGLNFFNTMEYQMRHMDRLFGEVHRRGATTFEISEEANTAYRDRMTQLLGKTVFEKGTRRRGPITSTRPARRHCCGRCRCTTPSTRRRISRCLTIRSTERHTSNVC